MGTGFDLHEKLAHRGTFLVGFELEAEASLFVADGRDRRLDFEALFAKIERHDALRTSRDDLNEAASEAGLADVGAGTKNDGVLADEVHAAV